MSHRTIFLDDGGVMSDNELRAPQWQHLVGEFMAPRLGRSRQDWSAVNWDAFTKVFIQYEPRRVLEPLSTFCDDYLFDWLRAMCERTGVDIPERCEAISIAREANAYVTRRVHAAFPGAVDTIRQLHENGYRLHTTSAEHSGDLTGYLETMGVLGLFDRLYGPDLVDLPLSGPEYYIRLFEDSGTEAREAIVVYDSPERAGWVIDAGASVVLVVRDRAVPNPSSPAIPSLAGLPPVLETTLAP